MSTEVQNTTSSQHDAKLLVMRRAFAVYPDSVRKGLSNENKPVAWFLHKEQAEKFGKLMWEKFYVVKEVDVLHGA